MGFTRRDLKGFQGEQKVAKRLSKYGILFQSNPLTSIEAWKKHQGMGCDFKIDSFNMEVESKNIDGKVFRSWILRDWIPRFSYKNETRVVAIPSTTKLSVDGLELLFTYNIHIVYWDSIRYLARGNKVFEPILSSNLLEARKDRLSKLAASSWLSIYDSLVQVRLSTEEARLQERILLASSPISTSLSIFSQLIFYGSLWWRVWWRMLKGRASNPYSGRASRDIRPSMKRDIKLTLNPETIELGRAQANSLGYRSLSSYIEALIKGEANKDDLSEEERIQRQLKRLEHLYLKAKSEKEALQILREEDKLLMRLKAVKERKREKGMWPEGTKVIFHDHPPGWHYHIIFPRMNADEIVHKQDQEFEQSSDHSDDLSPAHESHSMKELRAKPLIKGDNYG
ncbi:MAG: hypothetical protein QXI68_04240 [Sulfolobales archaeon]